MTKVHIISEGSLQAKEFFKISFLICCSVRTTGSRNSTGKQLLTIWGTVSKGTFCNIWRHFFGVTTGEVGGCHWHQWVEAKYGAKLG